MAASDSVRPEITALRALLETILKGDWVSPATNPAFGALNFSEIIPHLEGISVLLRAFSRSDMNLISEQRANNITVYLNEFLSFSDQVATFDIQQTNARQRRDQIENQIRDVYNKLLEVLGPPLGVWSAISTDLEGIKAAVLEQLRPSLSEAEARYQKALADIQGARAEAESSLAAIKEAAGRSGVTAHATVFADQASEHASAAKIWIGLTIAALAAMAAWGFVVLVKFQIPPDAGPGVIAQDIFTRVVVFTGISYALIWSARNYSANRHNYILNKHRQNSLTTFEAFVKAANDEDTKNAVLIQATTSIFSAQATGYGGKDAEVDQPSKILEIFKSSKA